MKVSTLPPLFPDTDPSYRRELFNALQAALYLGVSRAFIYRIAGAHEIGCAQTGTGPNARYRFSQHDLDTWRSAQRQEARKGPVAKMARMADQRVARPTAFTGERRFS